MRHVYIVITPYAGVNPHRHAWSVARKVERGRAILVEIDDDVPEEVFHAANPYEDVETRYDLSLALAKLRKPFSASPAALKEIFPSLSKRAAWRGSHRHA